MKLQNCEGMNPMLLLDKTLRYGGDNANASYDYCIQAKAFTGRENFKYLARVFRDDGSEAEAEIQAEYIAGMLSRSTYIGGPAETS